METLSSPSAAAGLCLDVIFLCREYLKDAQGAKAEIKHLEQVVSSFQNLMKSVDELLCDPKGARLEDTSRVNEGIREALSELQKLHDALALKKRQKAMSKLGIRALKWPFEKQDVQTRVSRLEQCMQTINMSMQVDQTKILLSLDHKALLDSLPVAAGASFDSFEEDQKPKCLAGTRVELLAEIAKWAKKLESHAVFWLNGMAGTGKSTISRTIAESMAADNSLGASFFFKRGEADRGGLLKFFTTVAADLVQRLPGFALSIKQAIDARPDIIRGSLRSQFEQLILDPLSNIPGGAAPRDPIIIIVDALDECDDTSVGLLIQLFSRFQHLSSPRVKAFLTSRPELPLRLGFKKINGTYDGLILHEVAAPVIGRDIYNFLKQELTEIRDDFNSTVEGQDERQLPDSWPGVEDIQILVNMAIPLFIFASTTCRFIAERRFGNPKDQLEQVLRYRTKNPESQLYATYLPVLDQQIGRSDGSTSLKEKIIQEFQTIVGSIIILENPLSITALSRLLDVPRKNIADRLDMLHSVLSVPRSAYEPVRLLHLSFRDFLLDPAVRDKTPLWVDGKQTHRDIARHCLRVLNDNLKRDICGLKMPSTPRSDAQQNTIDTHLSAELQYACLYWVHHLREHEAKLFDGDEVHQFLLCHLLHWLEALSLMGRMRQGIGLIKLLLTLIAPQPDTELFSFLKDAERFTRTHASDIESWPLQVYHSALIFTPLDSIVKKNYKDELPSWLPFVPLVDQRWDSCLQVIENDAWVESLDLSYDSTLVASNFFDEIMRIWQVDTGECLQELRHAGRVYSMRFSHDASLLASACVDGAVYIWSVKTGNCVRTLRTPRTQMELHSIAFSHDSKLVASAGADESAYMVYIWDANTGNCTHEIPCESRVLFVAFSPNSALIAIVATREVRVWNMVDGTGVKHDIPGEPKEYGRLAAISHDLSLIAMVSGNLVHIWHADSDWTTVEAKGLAIRCAAFSGDSSLIAFGLASGVIMIRRTDTWECVEELAGHNLAVVSLAFSYDSTRLASTSFDKTVRIWDTRFELEDEVQEPPASSWSVDDGVSSIMSLRVSQDSALVASLGFDTHVVKVWSTKNGHCIRGLEYAHKVVFVSEFSVDNSMLMCITQNGTAHLSRIDTGDCIRKVDTGGQHDYFRSTIVASPNFGLLASRFADNGNHGINVWHFDTGDHVHTLIGHVTFVEAMAFSSDSKFLASTDDGVVNLWDAETGTCIHELIRHNPEFTQNTLIEFSCDSTFVAVGSTDNTPEYMIRIWNVQTGECICSLSDIYGLDHTFPMRTCLAVSHEASLIALNINDSIRIWRTDTSKEMQGIHLAEFCRLARFRFENHKALLVTNIGSFNIPETRDDEMLATRQPRRSGYGVSSDGDWIMWDDNNLVKIPPKYQPYTVEVQDSILAFGDTVGQVLILAMSKEVFRIFEV